MTYGRLSFVRVTNLTKVPIDIFFMYTQQEFAANINNHDIMSRMQVVTNNKKKGRKINK
jgi:hypothetical protein